MFIFNKVHGYLEILRIKLNIGHCIKQKTTSEAVDTKIITKNPNDSRMILPKIHHFFEKLKIEPSTLNSEKAFIALKLLALSSDLMKVYGVGLGTQRNIVYANHCVIIKYNTLGVWELQRSPSHEIYLAAKI